MKRILLVAIVAAALAGCDSEDNYDERATVRELKQECVNYGAKLQSYYFGSYEVSDSPWAGNCINTSTGNKFRVFVLGVRRQ